MPVLVTNNPLVDSVYRNEVRVEYNDESLKSLLIRVRDYIHSGYCLLTHPLSGSVKPNETPYKSVMISERSEGTDMRSVQIIEESLLAIQKFEPVCIPENCLPDLQIIDLALIGPALENI